MNKQKPVSDENRAIVKQIAESQALHKIIMKITDNGNSSPDPTTLDDLEQDLYLSLLEDTKVPNIWKRGEMNFYLARMVLNNIVSTQSPYARTYFKFRNLSEPIPTEDSTERTEEDY